jgi:hypothetical protein
MSFQAYLDNIQAKTGKTPKDFQALAAKKGLVQYREIMAWLKTDFELGHGHANAIAHVITSADAPKTNRDDAIAGHFAGRKVIWRKSYDRLLAKVSKFGPDVEVSPTKSYLSLVRGGKKFAVLEPATPERFDIGLKLKGVAPTGRLEPAGAWNGMVTHRVRVTDPKQIDAELLAWLKQAYTAA